jgi:hypothetical protein
LLALSLTQELDGDDTCFDMSAAMAPGIWLYGAASLLFFAIGALLLRNVHREYAPYLARTRRKQQRSRRLRRLQREGGGTGGTGSVRASSFFWRSFSSSRAATVPLLLDEEGEDEEGVEEEGVSHGLPPNVTITVRPHK